jgi:hypothetical protein
MTQLEEQIEIGFKSGDVDFLDAVVMLQKCGYEPREAGQIVADWEEDMRLCPNS